MLSIIGCTQENTNSDNKNNDSIIEESNKYNVPITTKEDATLLVMDLIKNNLTYEENCDRCNNITEVYNISDTWNVILDCQCDFRFDSNLQHIQFPCSIPAMPECGQPGPCIINTEINCSSDSECIGWNRNATCNPDGTCAYCLPPSPCPHSCVKFN